MLLGEVQMRQNICLALVHEPRKLRPFLPQLVSDMAQRLAGLRAIRLMNAWRSAAATNGIATLNAEKKRGVAEPPAEEKRRDEQMVNQANRSIQRTQRETTTTPSAAPAVR